MIKCEGFLDKKGVGTMLIDIETLKQVDGVGEKTIQKIIEQHNKTKMIEEQQPTVDMKCKTNEIYQADAVEFLLNNVPSNTVDLTVTSPPYDALREYNGYEFNYEKMLKEIYRVTKKGGVCVWVVGDQTKNGSETGTSFKQALKAIEIGFKLHDTMIYKKNTSSFPASRKGKRYTQIFEYMFIFSKGTPKTANLICDKENKWAGYTNWGKNTQRKTDGELYETKDIKEVPKFSPRNNIWEYVVGGGFGTKDKAAYKHPATFPEKLAEDNIITWSNEGDLVLDVMCGSGTTCKMAKINKRNFIGIDISGEYVEIAKERIRKC